MWKHKNFINLQLYALTLKQLNNIYVFVDLVLTKIGEDLSGTPGVTPSITIAENKIISTVTSFYNITENDYASASSDSKELLIKDGWKIKNVEYPYIVGDGGTLYNVGDSFNATEEGNGLYITLEQSTPQKLPTPTNVSITGTTVQWDEVANATSYDVLVDGEVWENVPQPSSGETWVLNESLSDTTDGRGFSADISFTSYSRTYTTIKLLLRVGRDGVIVHYDSTEVYNSIIDDGWYDQAYRTITFSTAPTGDLLTWLQANGTKQ